nr:MAG TPA: Mga helix-turn-helix domain [Caudoviricetes sp.]
MELCISKSTYHRDVNEIRKLLHQYLNEKETLAELYRKLK